MVSRIIKIGMLLLVVLSFTSCIWFYGIFSEEGYDDTNQVSYYLKNNTQSTIILKSKNVLKGVYDTIDRYQYMTIPADSNFIIFCGAASEYYNKNLFDLFFNHNVVEDTMFMYSQDSVLLKVWTESNRFGDGKQLFNESYWTKKSWTDDYYIYTEYTFDLMPEDIQK